MKRIVLFKPEESRAIEDLIDALEAGGKLAEIDRIETLQEALERLGASISLYPPIIGTDRLAGHSRSTDTLVQSLCEKDETEVAFNIPTKAILGKSYLMAKINLFSMLLYTTREVPTIKDMDQRILPLITSLVFTMMAEEVFLDIIVDRGTPVETRQAAGALLIDLWEYRLDHGVERFAPILSQIWEARKSLAPAYGTLQGTTERLQLSAQIDSDCHDLLDELELPPEEECAFDEFLFGLSYEDLCVLRAKMSALGKGAVRGDEIGTMLQREVTARGRIGNNPRTFYSFFVQRRNNASSRARMNLKGPHKTLEEHLMVCLIGQAKRRAT